MSERGKKNCYNCKHLEFIEDTDLDGYDTGGSGFVCHKQFEYDETVLIRLEKESYRNKSKRCFEAKHLA